MLYDEKICIYWTYSMDLYKLTTGYLFFFSTLSRAQETIIFPQYSYSWLNIVNPTYACYIRREEIEVYYHLELAIFALRYCFLIFENVICYICMNVYCLYMCNRILIDKQFGEFALQNGGNHFRARRLFLLYV